MEHWSLSEQVRPGQPKRTATEGWNELSKAESCPSASQELHCTTAFANGSRTVLTQVWVSATLLLLENCSKLMVMETSARKQIVVFKVICCQLYPLVCMLTRSFSWKGFHSISVLFLSCPQCIPWIIFTPFLTAVKCFLSYIYPVRLHRLKSSS